MDDIERAVRLDALSNVLRFVVREMLACGINYRDVGNIVQEVGISTTLENIKKKKGK